jgi:hypothetical protein
MRYQMNWKIDANARCEICNALHWQSGMTWGIVHGQCFCNVCDAPYTMVENDPEYRHLTTPCLMLRGAFVGPARRWWNKNHTGLDRLEMRDWIRLGVPEAEFSKEEE